MIQVLRSQKSTYVAIWINGTSVMCSQMFTFKQAKTDNLHMLLGVFIAQTFTRVVYCSI